jgi:hypothetical protein
LHPLDHAVPAASAFQEGGIMSKRIARAVVRRVNGPRKLRFRMGPRAPLLFVVIVLLSAGLAIWLNDRFERAEAAYQHYRAGHPYRPDEKPPKVDWLTGRVWH